jgi:electron transport complex protein RnfB
MIAAITSITFLGLLLGLLLGFADRRLRVESNPLVAEIEGLLPGSQCGQCGYAGCSALAAALVAGEAPVTRCPPGGRSLVEQLANLLGITVDLRGIAESESRPLLAEIQEEACIGCTRCFKVCPTDAIIGGPKQIHAVIRDACTGCGKCVEICPTGCAQMHPLPVTLQNWYWPKPVLAGI